MSVGDQSYDDIPPKGSLERLRALRKEHPELERRIRFRRYFVSKFDVPYLAGSSLDGKRVYFDPKLIAGTEGDEWTRKCVALHEVIEWALKILFRDYEERHHLATAGEYSFVTELGHTPREYRTLLRPLYAPIEHEKITNCPPDLDLTPYSGKLKGYLYDLQHGKLPKARVDYGKGHKLRHCALCTMFRAPNDCTLVAGDIRAEDVCDRFLRSTK